MKKIAYLCCAFALSAFHADAAPTKQEISYKVATDFIIPAYQNFAKEASKQADLWKDSCFAKGAEEEFQKTSDAWAQVQHINFGPITLLLRRDRLYHWPERRNSVSKGLNKILAAKNPDHKDPENFASTSVAVQGFPALERLLFTEMKNEEWSCEIARAITNNIATIATENVEDWNDTLEYFKKGEGHPFYFDNMDEVSLRLFTELLTGFQMISDQKILLPMGKSIEKAKGKRAEAWRAARSTRYIQENAKALQAMAAPFISFLPAKEKQIVNAQFNSYIEAANTLPASIKDAVKDEAARKQLKAFLAVNRETRNILVEKFTKHLDLTVGFNSLDGD